MDRSSSEVERIGFCRDQGRQGALPESLATRHYPLQQVSANSKKHCVLNGELFINSFGTINCLNLCERCVWLEIYIAVAMRIFIFWDVISWNLFKLPYLGTNVCVRQPSGQNSGFSVLKTPPGGLFQTLTLSLLIENFTSQKTLMFRLKQPIFNEGGNSRIF